MSSQQYKKGIVLWLTGLSGAGKTTVADKVYEYLINKDLTCERMDGDVVRKSINEKLDFSEEGRKRNVEIAGFVAKMLSRHGVIVLASFISPYAGQRERMRDEVDDFLEIYVNAPLHVCERRDVKGLYAKARKGKISDFTGIDAPYEPPTDPHIELNTDKESVDESLAKVVDYLEKNGYI